MLNAQLTPKRSNLIGRKLTQWGLEGLDKAIERIPLAWLDLKRTRERAFRLAMAAFLGARKLIEGTYDDPTLVRGFPVNRFTNIQRAGWPSRDDLWHTGCEVTGASALRTTLTLIRRIGPNGRRCSQVAVRKPTIILAVGARNFGSSTRR